MQFFKSTERIPVSFQKKFLTTKYKNEELIIYLCDDSKDIFQKVPGFNHKGLVANYFSTTNELQLYENSSSDVFEHQFTFVCYYYDEPGQQAFVISRHDEEICISTVGPNPIFVQVPSFNTESSDLLFLEISGIKKFTNPKQGFDIIFTNDKFLEEATSTILIKKIFIKKLLGEVQQTNTNAIVASNSKPIMKMMKFTWINENTNKWDHVPIDVAVWSKEISPESNAENELEMNDLATTDSKIVGHLYQNSTFRVTEISRQATWLVNVRPFTGWLCQIRNEVFMVANHRHKSYISLENQNLLIDLPTKFSSNRSIKVVKAYTRVDADNEDDTFYVQFQGVENIPQEYSFDELIDSKIFTNKYRSQKVKGVWVGTSSYGEKINAEFNLWPDKNFSDELDENRKREDNIENTVTYRQDIDGHCYPKSKIIKLATKKGSFLSERYVKSNIIGTYYETTDGPDKKGAIIAVINNVKTENEDNAEKTALLNTIKKYMTQQIMVVDDLELAQEVIEKVVDSIAQQLIIFSTKKIDEITATIVRFKIIDKITSHTEIKKFITSKKGHHNHDALSSNIEAIHSIFGNSTETKVSEVVASDILNSCKLAKVLYIMIDKNFEPEKNLSMPIEEGYQDIQFTDDDIKIIYNDRTISHKLRDLILQPKRNYMDRHHVLTIEIESITTLSSHSKKTILSVWKDLTVQEDQYIEEYDNSMKIPLVTALNLKPEEIAVAHLYLKNNSLWIVNNYDGRAGDPDDIVLNGWMINNGSENLLIIKTGIQFIFILLDEDKKQYSYKAFCKEFLNLKDCYPGIKSISLDESKQSLVITYFDRFSGDAEESEHFVFNTSFKELIQKCKPSTSHESDSTLELALRTR